MRAVDLAVGVPVMWSQLPGQWDAEECTSTVVGAAMAPCHHNLSDIVEGLNAALDKQIGGKTPKDTDAAHSNDASKTLSATQRSRPSSTKLP